MQPNLAVSAPPAGRPVRRLLDALYSGSAVLAGSIIVMTLVLVVVQMVSRLVRVTVPGVQDLAGYSLAATAFLALASTLRAGSHVRVNLLLAHLPPRAARLLDIWCCLLGVVVSGYIAYWSVDLVTDSYEFGEVASALLPVPLWIPRITMVLGTVVLTIAFVDELVHVLAGGRPRYERPEAQTEG